MLVASLPAPANDLLQLYGRALEHDAVLAAATYQRDAAIEVRPQAVASWLPQINAQAGAQRERAGYDTGAVLSSVAANCVLSANGQSEHCYGNAHSYGLTLTQTIWSWQQFNQLKEASIQVAGAQATLLAAQQSLLLRLAQAYFAILGAEDQLATDRDARTAFATLLQQAQTRQSTGVGPRSDVDQAQAFYDATEQGLIDAQNSLDDARLALTELVGTHSDQLAPLQEDIPLSSPEPASVDDWVLAALQDNPSVRAGLLLVDADEREIAVQRGKALPTLTLNGSVSRLYQDQGLGGDEPLDTVGVSFSWPLFQGGAVASAVRQSRALSRQARATYETLRRDTERQTRAAYRDVVTGAQRVTAARQATQSGERAVEASRRNLEFGTGTEFDLLNSQNNYYVARRAYSQTRYDYLTSMLTLKQQAGRISENDLSLIDRMLVEHE